MAKRKRLTPANPAFLAPAPETKSALALHAPLADVAREASATAAVEEMAQTLARARAEGRMVIAVPLAQVRLDYLVRDRLGVTEDEQGALIDSIKRRGQQTPVELVDLGEAAAPRYGLISGWRRVMALRSLAARDADRFGQVLGLLRQPAEAAQAYLAMIEENEIRVGLSHFERARIALKAVEQGALTDEGAALRTLYGAASRAKRSKIGSFMTVVRALDGALRFPAALGERLGLALAQALTTDPGLAARLRAALAAAGAESPDAEQAVIREEIARARGRRSGGASGGPTKSASSDTHDRPSDPVHLRRTGRYQVVLEGRGVDEQFLVALETWLEGRGSA